MKRKLILILPALFFTLIFATCRKDPGPITDFYFQCKINGKNYILALGNNITCEILADTTLLLGGNIGFQALGIGIINITEKPTKDTVFILDNNPRCGATYKNSTITYDKYDTDSLYTGQLHIIILNKINKIIQGTFHFKAYNSYRNDSVSVTDGVFRLHYIIS